MFGRRNVGGLAATAVVTGLVVLTTPAAVARADGRCRTVEVSWTTPGSGFAMATGLVQTYDTGVVVPAPGAGETATVVSSSWASFDRDPEGGTATREDSGQTNERWGITIGGTSFGGLTTDLPDSVDQGAVTPWSSGLVTGSFGTGSIGSGTVVLRHASLYGFTESPNSVFPQQVELQIQYCCATSESTTSTTSSTVPEETTTAVPALPAPEETSTTTGSATTSSTTPPVATAAPTTSTTTDTTGTTDTTMAEPTTTFVLPLLTAPTIPQLPTSTTITPAGPTLPTTVPLVPSTTSAPGRLPETGSDVTNLLRTGLALVLVGSVLAVVRRRLVL